MTDHDDDPMKQIDASIMAMAEEYASCDEDSKALNDRRKHIRETIESRGLHPLAWQHAVGMVKKMTPGERRDYQTSLQRILGVIGDKQMELFPADAERLRKREERRATEAAQDPAAQKAAADARTDSNPMSDPNRGGVALAQAATGMVDNPVKDGVPAPETPPTVTLSETAAAGDKMIKETLAKKSHDAEQAEGGKVLSLVGGKKPAQSEIAKRKLASAGLN